MCVQFEFGLKIPNWLGKTSKNLRGGVGFFDSCLWWALTPGTVSEQATSEVFLHICPGCLQSKLQMDGYFSCSFQLAGEKNNFTPADRCQTYRSTNSNMFRWLCRNKLSTYSKWNAWYGCLYFLVSKRESVHCRRRCCCWRRLRLRRRPTGATLICQRRAVTQLWAAAVSRINAW